MFFGAVQLGVMAACIVLFVPMGMAGYHLSRNKVLFFSGALFITLAVGVHLIPYFPSFSTLIPPSPSIVLSPDRNSCISLLHEIVYNVDSTNNDTDDGEENERTKTQVSWNWENSRADVVECEFQKLGQVDVSVLLNGSWVVVAGDSQARLFVVSLLNLVLGVDEMESVKGDLFKRHSDYRIDVDRIRLRLDFLWAPYVTNLTNVVLEFERNNTYPDVLVMGAGLWHMLHFTNSSDYGASLGSLRESLASMIPVSSEFGLNGPASHRSPHLFWLGMPSLINTMLNTEEKREKMTEVMCDAYDRELLGSKLLCQYGGSFLLLDIQSLSRKCGTRCSMDGMHYDATVYEALVHIILNALLIESHQKL